MQADYNRLKTLLIDSMEGMTQNEFAAACGISRSHMNRILNNPAKHKPSKLTLKKISEQSSASYNQLLEACGYESETPFPGTQKEFHIKSLTEKTCDAFDVFKEGSETIARSGRFFRSTEEFTDLCRLLFNTENVHVKTGASREYYGTLVPYAEYYAAAVMSIQGNASYTKLHFLIYFNQTTSGMIMINTVRGDGEALIEAGILSSEFIINSFDSMEEAKKAQHICYMVYDGKYKSAEERLLANIFGDEDTDPVFEYTTQIAGFGISVDNIQNFRNFFLNHDDAFRNDNRLSEYLVSNHIHIEDALPEELADFIDPINGEKGMAAMIAYIMRQESGFPYCVEKDKNNHLYIVITNDEPENYDEDDVKNITEMYARQLQAQEYGIYIITVPAYIEGPMRFSITNEEE